jgi:uroporphyrinogen-III synthase
MRLLITRALDEAARTAAKLQDLGHEAFLSPVLEMRATGAVWPQGCFNGLLATSAQAFELLTEAYDWPLPEAKRLWPLYLVGQKTFEAAQRKGFLGPATLAPDAKELAKELISKAAPSKTFLYLAGRDRKPDLEDQLKAAGLHVEVCEIYQAEAAEHLSREAQDALSQNAIDAVLHYSHRSGEIFLKLAQDAGIDPHLTTHICISKDAAQPFIEIGCSRIHMAATPNEPVMLEILSFLKGPHA